jgi:hypothetical protein
MRSIFLTMVLALVFFFSGESQNEMKHDNTWLLGNVPNIPASLSGGIQLDFNHSPVAVSFFEISIDFTATSMISDSSGQLLAYTNGCVIINQEHEEMEGGGEINPGYIHDQYCEIGYPAWQGVLFLPSPQNNEDYYLFHTLLQEGGIEHNLLYTVVDSEGDNGKGSVTQKNVPLLQDTLVDQLTAVRHGNGRDWWLVIPRGNEWLGSSNGYYFILWTPDGFEEPIYQEIGNEWSSHDHSGQVAYSPNGEWYARINPFNELDLFRFDRCAGALYDPLHISFPEDTVACAGVAFSPNSRFLYASYQLKVYQFDLWAPDISASRQVVAEYDGFQSPPPFSTTFFQAMLAPDGKIYLTAPNGVNILHVIHQPDKYGQACEVEQHGLTLPATHSFNVPNFPHYRLLDKPGSPCDTLGIDGGPMVGTEAPVRANSQELVLYPNPVGDADAVSLQGPEGTGQVEVYDLRGIRFYSAAHTSGEALPVGDLPRGVYVVVWEAEDGNRWVGRLVR